LRIHSNSGGSKLKKTHLFLIKNTSEVSSLSSEMGLSTAVIRSIVTDSMTAPSGDNSQPWEFEWDGQKLHIIFSEEELQHPLDKFNQSSLLTLGGLLAALRLSASRYGLKSEVHLIEGSLVQRKEAFGATVTFVSTQETPHPLSSKISSRTTDRRVYRGGELSSDLKLQIEKLANDFPGCFVKIQDHQSIEFMKYFLKSEKLFWNNSKIIRSISKWVRLSKSEEVTSRDGMTRKSLAINQLEAYALRLIRLFPFIPKLFWNLGFGFKILADSRKSIDSSAALVCFASSSSEPAALVRLGEFSYLVWLILNSNGFGVQPLSYCSTSIMNLVTGAFEGDGMEAEHQFFRHGREVVQKNFGFSPNQIPTWLFRTGLSPVIGKESRSLRRSPRLFFS
jgi:hypothetical protein